MESERIILDYAPPPKRWFWKMARKVAAGLAILIIAAGVGAGIGYLITPLPHYAAQGLLQIAFSKGGPSAPPSTMPLAKFDEEVERLVMSEGTRKRILDRAALQSRRRVSDLQSTVAFHHIRRTELVRVYVTDANPDVAVDTHRHVMQAASDELAAQAASDEPWLKGRVYVISNSGGAVQPRRRKMTRAGIGAMIGLAAAGIVLLLWSRKSRTVRAI